MKCSPIFFFQGELHVSVKLLGIISLGFNAISELLIRCSEFVSYWTRVGLTVEQYLSVWTLQENTQFTYARSTVGLHVHVRSPIPTKLVRLVKCCA